MYQILTCLPVKSRKINIIRENKYL